MATRLFLHHAATHPITGTGDGVLYDMRTTSGVLGAFVEATPTAASGTEIQCTLDDLTTTIAWISGRTPTGGFTLTSTDISCWFSENSMNANIGGRYRVFKRTAAGVITELGGGPFNDGVEFNTTITEMLWVGNVTDTAFAEDDRVLLRVYLTNIGTMASGFTGNLAFGGADGSTSDSSLNLAETVAFKAEEEAPVFMLPGNHPWRRRNLARRL